MAYCTESYVKVWLPSEAASAGGSGLSDGIRHTTLLRERGITTAAAPWSRSVARSTARMGRKKMWGGKNFRDYGLGLQPSALRSRRGAGGPTYNP